LKTLSRTAAEIGQAARDQRCYNNAGYCAESRLIDTKDVGWVGTSADSHLRGTTDIHG
jgi:hypothetical protein